MNNNSQIRRAIQLSVEAFIESYDPNEHRRITKTEAESLIKTLHQHPKNQECPICSENTRVSRVPCCGNLVCNECLINTFTLNTKDCPFCRCDLVAKIKDFPSSLDSKYSLKTENKRSNETDDDGNRITFKLCILLNASSSNKDANLSYIKFLYHNINEVNRKAFIDILKEFVSKANDGLIKDVGDVWNNICNKCNRFAKKYSKHSAFIPDSILRTFYNKIRIKINEAQIIT